MEPKRYSQGINRVARRSDGGPKGAKRSLKRAQKIRLMWPNLDRGLKIKRYAKKHKK